jgi:hypothetical protein
MTTKLGLHPKILFQRKYCLSPFTATLINFSNLLIYHKTPVQVFHLECPSLRSFLDILSIKAVNSAFKYFLNLIVSWNKGPFYLLHPLKVNFLEIN